ncbi:MAG: IclR family transcriptional regulator [Hyphomicrobiaceae bacterium]
MQKKKSSPARRGATAPGGSQSILRAMSVLRFVASGREEGRRLSEVAQALNLNVATAHRLLGTLVYLGFLVHRSANKSYRVGPELISLAAIAHAQFAFRELFHGPMRQIAEATGDTVLLQVRSGDETVCISRASGSMVFATVVMDVGKRLPLGIGASGLAMLAYMDEDECEEVLERCRPAYEDLGLSVETIRASVRKSRALGYGFQEGQLTREVAGIGVLLLDASGIAAAVSVIGLRQRFDPARRKHVVEAIRAACADIQGLTLFPPVDERPARKVAKGAARRGLRAVNTER